MCSVSFILHNFIIRWLYLSWKNPICTKLWTGAVVRYYGDWKWCCSYIFCYKPIQFGHVVGNKLYFTKILTFIPIKGKSKSYKHSLIIYWTALVYSTITCSKLRCSDEFRRCNGPQSNVRYPGGHTAHSSAPLPWWTIECFRYLRDICGMRYVIRFGRAYYTIICT